MCPRDSLPCRVPSAVLFYSVTVPLSCSPRGRCVPVQGFPGCVFHSVRSPQPWSRAVVPLLPLGPWLAPLNPPCHLTLKSSQRHITGVLAVDPGDVSPLRASGPKCRECGLSSRTHPGHALSLPEQPNLELWVSTPTPLSSQRSFGNHKWLSPFSLQMSVAAWGAGGCQGNPECSFHFQTRGH